MGEIQLISKSYFFTSSQTRGSEPHKAHFQKHTNRCLQGCPLIGTVQVTPCWERGEAEPQDSPSPQPEKRLQQDQRSEVTSSWVPTPQENCPPVLTPAIPASSPAPSTNSYFIK